MSKDFHAEIKREEKKLDQLEGWYTKRKEKIISKLVQLRKAYAKNQEGKQD